MHSDYVIQRTARERIEFLTGQISYDFCFLTFVLLWMRSGLGTELFAMNGWSYGGFGAWMCSPDCVLSVLQFLCVSRFLEHLSLSCNHTYPVLRLQSIRSHKTDTICVNSGPQVQNPCMKRTSSITCNMTVHETRADCRKLWIPSSHANVSQYQNAISLPFVCVVSFNVSMHTKTIQWSSRINSFTDIQNPSRKVCSECILFLKWSRDHTHWSVAWSAGGFGCYSSFE